MSQKEIKYFKTKSIKLPGTSFSEPYLRSKYFKNEKVFLTLFWSHLVQKRERDRVRRLKFFPCAMDLIIKSALNPETRENFQKKDELLHRFYGETKDGDKFVVQIKENKRSKRKGLISIYNE